MHPINRMAPNIKPAIANPEYLRFTPRKPKTTAAQLNNADIRRYMYITLGKTKLRNETIVTEVGIAENKTKPAAIKNANDRIAVVKEIIPIVPLCLAPP